MIFSNNLDLLNDRSLHSASLDFYMVGSRNWLTRPPTLQPSNPHPTHGPAIERLMASGSETTFTSWSNLSYDPFTVLVWLLAFDGIIKTTTTTCHMLPPIRVSPHHLRWANPNQRWQWNQDFLGFVDHWVMKKEVWTKQQTSQYWLFSHQLLILEICRFRLCFFLGVEESANPQATQTV